MFPYIVSVTQTDVGSDLETHTVNYPASGIERGDLGILLASCDGSGETFQNVGGGWSPLLNEAGPGAAGGALAAFKYFNGSENGDTFPVGVTGGAPGETAVYQLFLIRGHDPSKKPELSSATFTTSTTITCDPLSPSWGAQDALWIWATMRDPQNHVLTAFPAGYDDNQLEWAISGTEYGSHATRKINRATESPGDATLDNANSGHGIVVGIPGFKIYRPVGIVPRRKPSRVSVFDSFTGANGDPMELHKPDFAPVGAHWLERGFFTDATSSGDDDTIQNNGIQLGFQDNCSIIETLAPDCIIEAEYICDATNGRESIVYRKDPETSGSEGAFNLRPPNGDWRLFDASGAQDDTNTFSWTDGQVYHIMVVCLGPNVWAYIDRVLVGTASSTANMGYGWHGLGRNTSVNRTSFNWFKVTKLGTRPPSTGFSHTGTVGGSSPYTGFVLPKPRPRPFELLPAEVNVHNVGAVVPRLR